MAGRWWGGGSGETSLDQRDRNTTINVICELCVNPDPNKPIGERHLPRLYTGCLMVPKNFNFMIFGTCFKIL